MAAIIETFHVSHCGHQEAGCPGSGLAVEQNCQLCAQSSNVLLGIHAAREDKFVEVCTSPWRALAPV